MKPTLFITGGTGFLGRHLALALRDRYDVVLGGRNNKQNLAAGEVTGCRVLPLDVARIEAVRDAFLDTRPQTVIHAAATKFVDQAERLPLECVDVNAVGSANVARAARDAGVEFVLGISTDKAAPPVRNTYGLTKALMERMFCALDGTAGTRFACVRYGNVAWSTGSVLPIWQKMHDETGLIRSTGPDMTRFFFPVAEAVRLIETALRHRDAVRGKVLARRMKSARIRDLLAVWVETRGGAWEPMAGRPGERDDEFLIGESELPYTTEVAFDGVPHYLITFNQKSARPLAASLSSQNAERLTRAEMVDLLNQRAE
jgi:FlaA1/EpsC-like NDP-sugar epimerase